MDGLKNLTHHAYYIIGGEAAKWELIPILEKKHGIKIQGNSDFIDPNFVTLAIDDARYLKSWAGTRPMTEDGKRIAVISTNNITVEAQNALLKLFEEPSDYAHFFLIIPSAHLLLPTVKSRMSRLDVGDAGNRTTDPELHKAAAAFLKLSVAKRLDEVKKLVDDIAKEKKTKQHAIEFLNAIEEAIYVEKGVKEGRQALETIQGIRTYMTDRAPSVKMLLEYVALSI